MEQLAEERLARQAQAVLQEHQVQPAPQVLPVQAVLQEPAAKPAIVMQPQLRMLLLPAAAQYLLLLALGWPIHSVNPF
jgi:hypothetical protein